MAEFKPKSVFTIYTAHRLAGRVVGLRSLIEVGEPLNIKLEPSQAMLAAIKAEAAKR